MSIDQYKEDGEPFKEAWKLTNLTYWRDRKGWETVRKHIDHTITLLLLIDFSYEHVKFKANGGLIIKVSASQPHDCQHHDSSYDTNTGWFQEADSIVIEISCVNLLHNRAKNK